MAERDKTGAELGNPLPVKGSVGRDGAQGRRVPRTALGRESQRGSHSPQGRTGRGIIPREGHSAAGGAQRHGGTGRAAGGAQRRGRDTAPRGRDEGAVTRGLRRGGCDEGAATRALEAGLVDDAEDQGDKVDDEAVEDG